MNFGYEGTHMKLPKNITVLLFITSSVLCQVKLPKLISDGMVLQRDAKVRIWGWASEGEKISIHFIDSMYHTTANKNGEWEMMMSNLKAGGPYDMQLGASNSIVIHDIIIGDVWICSGQSNMALSMGSLAAVYPDEIKNSENIYIRQFSVPVSFNVNGQEKDVKVGRWQHADPKSVRSFTAAGYFFAKKINEAYKVPIGLIHASLGGSSAEAWISEEAIKSFPKYYDNAQRFKNPPLIEKIKQQDDERVKNWYKELRYTDEGLKDTQHVWFDPMVNTSEWETIHVPAYWTETKLGTINGVVWFRKIINIPASFVGKPALLKLGRIFDVDSTFINGKFVGTTGSQYAQRSYKIPADLLQAGENTIVIRDISTIRHGGFVPGKQYEIIAGEDTVHLEGEWKYKLGTFAEPLEDRLFTGKIPTGLFNGMLSPLLNYSIKGVLWYQGESNTSRAFEHYDLFKLLINDWRSHWRQGNFPFLYVQLPNFVEVNEETTQYDWAFFRESQLKALALPNTGMAVTIDIGEFNDIHPVNKKDVGIRLALAAEKVAYGNKRIVSSGPIYQSMKIDGGKVLLTFAEVGSGLILKYGSELKGFEICGSDNKYFPAQAKIEKGKIRVWSKEIAKPVAVRYAWANNPDGANLFNREGLPASPFRTSELY
jgi:sialate O-acetylesterase